MGASHPKCQPARCMGPSIPAAAPAVAEGTGSIGLPDGDFQDWSSDAEAFRTVELLAEKVFPRFN